MKKTFNKVSLSIIGLLVLLALGLGYKIHNLNSYITGSEIKTLQNKLKSEKESAEYANELRDKWKEDLIAANKKHQEELDEVRIRYNDAVSDNNRLRNTITALNNNLSKLSRSTVESYAITAAHNLEECSGVTAEMEQLARSYNSEIEFLYTVWPRDTLIKK